MPRRIAGAWCFSSGVALAPFQDGETSWLTAGCIACACSVNVFVQAADQQAADVQLILPFQINRGLLKTTTSRPGHQYGFYRHMAHTAALFPVIYSGSQSAKTPRQTDITPSVTRRRDTAVSIRPSLLPPKQRRTRNRRPLATRHNLTGYDWMAACELPSLQLAATV